METLDCLNEIEKNIRRRKNRDELNTSEKLSFNCKEYIRLAKENKYNEIKKMITSDTDLHEILEKLVIRSIGFKEKLTRCDITFFEDLGMKTFTPKVLGYFILSNDLETVKYLLENYEFNLNELTGFSLFNRSDEQWSQANPDTAFKICKLLIEYEIVIFNDLGAMMNSVAEDEPLFHQLVTIAKERDIFTEECIAQTIFDLPEVKESLFIRLKDYLPNFSLDLVLESICNLNEDSYRIMNSVVHMLKHDYLTTSDLTKIMQEMTKYTDDKFILFIKMFKDLRKLGISVDEMLDQM